MGIELDYLTRNKPIYNIRCDNCDAYREFEQSTPHGVAFWAHAEGWQRSGYLPSHRVYTWNCPKCKDR